MKSITLISSILISILSTSSAAPILECNTDETLIPTSVTINNEVIKECTKIYPSPDDGWFKRSERIRPATIEYNCHSLAYANRQNWIPRPNRLILKLLELNAYSLDITTALKGDRGVMFEKAPDGDWDIGNEKYSISHSWIFSENYISEQSIVQSKYGSLGEYIHAYKNIIDTYAAGKETFILVLPFSPSRSNSQSLDELLVDQKSLNVEIPSVFNLKDNVTLSYNPKLEYKYKHTDNFPNITTEDLILGIDYEEVKEIVISSNLTHTLHTMPSKKIDTILFRISNNEISNKEVSDLIKEKSIKLGSKEKFTFEVLSQAFSK